MFASCKKDDGIANANTGVAMQLKASNTAAVIQQAAGATTTATTNGANIQWTSGHATATLLMFEAKKGDGEVEFKSKFNKPLKRKPRKSQSIKKESQVK